MPQTLKDAPEDVLRLIFKDLDLRNLLRIRMINRRLQLLADEAIWEKCKPQVKILLDQLRDMTASAADARAAVGGLKKDMPFAGAAAKVYVRMNNELLKSAQVVCKQLRPTLKLLAGLAKGPDGAKFLKAAHEIEVAVGALEIRIEGIYRQIDKFLKS